MLPSFLESITPFSAVLAGVAVFLAIYLTFRSNGLPPGPTGLPYFGLWPHLEDERCHLQLEEYGRKYGDFFCFKYMGNLILNLGSIKAMRETHVQQADCFQERFTRFNILSYLLANGVSMVGGEPWKVLRKFFIQSFKEYGMTSLKDSTSGPIHESLTKTIEMIRQKNGQSFNVIDLLIERCGATIKKIIFGEDGVTDEELRIMNDAYIVSLDAMSGNKLLLIGPFARFIFRLVPSYRNALTQHRVMCAALRKVLRRIEANFDEEHPTNITEDFYKERNVRRRKNDPTSKYFNEVALVESHAQFVGDGIIAVAYFIGCFLYALVEHPEEEEKLYQEISEVVGHERLPTLEDRSRLPYTNAFMYEVVRTANFFSLFPSLECTKETTIRGYIIPKGTITLLNIWEAHHDPSTFEKPHAFDPQRYISKPGKPRAELPVQFGMGKRACTGEPLVMLESFLFLTTIVKNFRISEPKTSNSKSSMFLMTGNMELCFHPRTEK